MSQVLTAVLPSIGVLALFALVLRAIIHADRRERAAVDRAQSAADGATPDGGATGDSSPAAGADRS